MEPPTPPPTPPPTTLLGKYKLGRLLGRGSFAKVYHAHSLHDGEAVAVKVIDKSKSLCATMEARIVSEISAMRRLNPHPSILKIHEVMATKSKIYLIMELACGGELLSKIHRRGRLTEPSARRYFKQLVSALQFCHQNGVAHRDIKPQNLLLDDAGNLKLSDFGLSALPEQLKDNLLHTACGTPAYTAPEVIARKGYDGAKADAWSCGVILYVLLTGIHPFDDSNLITMYRKINRREFQLPEYVSKPARWIISRLLDPNPNTRISIESLTDTAWFKKSLDRKAEPICMFTKDVELSITPVMNAFDIISLSSGLDLSGLFEAVNNKKGKRFTTAEPPEKVEERVVDIGGKMGFSVVKGKGVVGLRKGRLVVAVEVLEVANCLFLVEVKVVDGGVEFEAVHWGVLKSGLDDIVVSWHNDAI